MATQQAFIEVKEYWVSVTSDVRWLTLSDPSTAGRNWPFYLLQLGFLPSPSSGQGKLLPNQVATCFLPVAVFSDWYRVVQTEKPVYARIWWEDTDNSVHSAMLSTSPEPPGEGFADPRGRF